MVEGHGVEARSNQPFAQDPGMSLCDSMNGPHVLVCVRVRGVFQKKKKNLDILSPQGASLRFFLAVTVAVGAGS